MHCKKRLDINISSILRPTTKYVSSPYSTNTRALCPQTQFHNLWTNIFLDFSSSSCRHSCCPRTRFTCILPYHFDCRLLCRNKCLLPVIIHKCCVFFLCHVHFHRRIYKLLKQCRFRHQLADHNPLHIHIHTTQKWRKRSVAI